MAKAKLKRKNPSEKLIKKSGKSKPLNPFEIRVNKQKFDVLGRKSKNDRGLPGIARAKSIKKRKETLLQEYKIKDKANKFVDRRIGENNSAMTQEDRIMARYTAERMKAHNKKTMFNLADDEVLTHRGKTLSEIEKYDDPGSDEEEEFSGRSGGLDADIVEAHFGGGIFHEKEDGAKTHASLIDELIAESKKRKAERQRAKEQTLELTDKLDADWHELLPLVGAGKANDDPEEKPHKGSYDQLMRELKFESRGVPSERLKSVDELAKEEKEKLEKLEEERLRRMKGVEGAAVAAPKHRSADDLDDGFDIDSEISDGENNEDPDENVNDDEGNNSESDDEEDDDDGDGDSSSGNKSDHGDDEDNSIEQKVEGDQIVENEISKLSNKENNSDENSNENEKHEEEGGSENEDSDSDDDLSDLKNLSDNEDHNDADLGDCLPEEKHLHVGKKSNKEKLAEEAIDESNSDKFIDSLKRKKELMEQARKELPYTFKLPESYEELESTMEGHSFDHQGVIIERMIKCHHPSLGENNKQKLEELFAYLLQYLNDADDEVVWKLLDRLAPHFFNLTQFSPENSARCLLEVLHEKHEDFKKKPHRFPEADTLVFLKLVPLLFPTSDVRHQVTTPAFVFLIQLINQCRVHGRRAISIGLFIVTMLLEYTSLSKRYSPETVNFLQGILEMAVPDVKISLPYCKVGYHPLILESLQEVTSVDDFRLSLTNLSSSDTPIDDTFRLCTLFTVIKLLNILCSQLENIPCFKSVFSPIEKLLKKLEVSKYPMSLRNEVIKLQTKLDKLCSKKLEYVVLEKKKPKALRLYEPKIERVVEGKKRSDISEEKAEQQKLLAKYKREMKGALREVRRDNAFLSKVQLRRQAKSDEERKRKVKQIYGWGATQEGEFNKLKRKKKH